MTHGAMCRVNWMHKDSKDQLVVLLEQLVNSALDAAKNPNGEAVVPLAINKNQNQVCNENGGGNTAA